MKNSVGIVLVAMFCLAFSGGGRADAWSFAVMGDTQSAETDPGVNTQVVHEIALAIVKDGCRIVLVTGDLVRGASASVLSEFCVWTNAMAAVYGAGIGVYPARGNHEANQDPAGNAWKETFAGLPRNGPPGESGMTYSFSCSNAFFVALDQHVTPNQVNQAWLDAQLASNTLSHVFVFGHKPAFRVYQKSGLSLYPARRDSFWNSLGTAGVVIYFCGHDHFYNRSVVPDSAGHQVFQVVAGCGGGQLYKWQPPYPDTRVKPLAHNDAYHGYCLVTIDGPAVRVEWKALQPDNTWQTLDSFNCTLPDSPNPSTGSK